MFRRFAPNTRTGNDAVPPSTHRAAERFLLGRLSPLFPSTKPGRELVQTRRIVNRPPGASLPYAASSSQPQSQWEWLYKPNTILLSIPDSFCVDFITIQTTIVYRPQFVTAQSPACSMTILVGETCRTWKPRVSTIVLGPVEDLITIHGTPLHALTERNKSGFSVNREGRPLQFSDKAFLLEQ